jgi:hypothetical protein
MNWVVCSVVKEIVHERHEEHEQFKSTATKNDFGMHAQTIPLFCVIRAFCAFRGPMHFSAISPRFHE